MVFEIQNCKYAANKLERTRKYRWFYS